ncbi:hypothetical protein LTR78_000312 [Recurvomyces mirabilis]|uniref:BTB domain-containing protein n=1 Tax=Recurvomyces mirabilis TaxID=574656 RepID=A0AAE0WWZ7_9PEZI|nr:hypothetical protein LTR78_000312 [Recurvomyces mirabilis]KAK5161967.1 hypothetical protein LTS14_000313 [Recurvomyces mirabilis]
MALERPRTAPRIEYEDIFTVLIGDHERAFAIHDSVVTKKSEFFRAACNGKFKAAKEKTIRLPEAEIESFRSYIQWCYNDTISIGPATSGSDESLNITRGAEEQRALSRLYRLASLFLDTTLQNKVIDTLRASIRYHKQGPGVDLVAYAYNNLQPGCTMQRLVLAWYVYRQDSVAEYLGRHREAFPERFWSDLVLTTAKARGMGED